MLHWRPRGRPWRVERVELDGVDIALRIFPAVNGTLNHIAQLTHIARPVVGFKVGHGARRETGPIGPLEFNRHSSAEVIGKQGYVATASAEGRKGNHLERQAI